MADNDKKEWKMELHPDFLMDLEKISQEDPEAAAALREILANMRQALEGVNTGQYATFDEGVEAITGQRPQKIGIDDDGDDDIDRADHD